MKTVRKVAIIVLSMLLLFGVTSCVVFTKHDHGKRKGWFKNSNNPHHPNSTNPGKGKKY